MLACVSSATVLGSSGRPVTVEVHVSNGLPGLTIVGLPDASCREARDRVRAAVLSSNLDWQLRRITVNLAPSGVRKLGAGLDLAVAVGFLGATRQIPSGELESLGFIGELGLDGSVRPVVGAVPLADAVEAPRIVVPLANLPEARVVVGDRAIGVRTLTEVVEALRGDAPWPPQPPPADPPPPEPGPDLADVRGQQVARLALEVAAAGGHHLLMVGPPGAGKTMLARRLAGLLPPLDRSTAMEVTRIHSAAGLAIGRGLIDRAPFRAPHHGASAAAMVGGGAAAMRPGEISLAHGGVLFLDELGEFAPNVLDALRQPLEDGVVRVARVGATIEYPARFLLVAAMNPCPCGEAGGPGACTCSEAAQARYHRRLSGPLVDRFDLRVRVHRPIATELLDRVGGEPSAEVAERVMRVRAKADERGVVSNAQCPAALLDEVAPLSHDANELLHTLLSVGHLSARGLDRVRRVALTLADLAGRSGPVDRRDIVLAAQLRSRVTGPAEPLEVEAAWRGSPAPARVVAPSADVGAVRRWAS